MIRIADILKAKSCPADVSNGPVKTSRVEPLTGFDKKAAELNQKEIYLQLMFMIDNLCETEELEERGQSIVRLLTVIVDQPSWEGEGYESIKSLFCAIKLGRDANYSRDRLIGLAVTALIHGLKKQGLMAEAGIRLLESTLSQLVDTRPKEYQDIINLVELYFEQ